MRRAGLALILSVFAPAMSLALVRAYSVEPQTAAQSGWTRFQDTVGGIPGTQY